MTSAPLAWPVTDLGRFDFDTLQCRSLAARLLERLLGGVSRPLHLLEVSSKGAPPFADFLDREQAQVVRCGFDRPPHDRAFVELRRGQPLPFAADSFDAVVACDVLEHFPCAERGRFLAECLRVARHGFVFTCPSGSSETSRAEALLDAVYRHRNSYPNPHLAEHAAFGLPTEEEVLACLRELGVAHAVFRNAPLATWMPLQVFTQTLGERGSQAAYVRDWLNRCFFPGLHDDGASSYRTAYVCAKTEAAAPALEPLPEMSARPGRPAELSPELAYLQTLATRAADTAAAIADHAVTLEGDNCTLRAELGLHRAELLRVRQMSHLAQCLLDGTTRSRPWKLHLLLQRLLHVLKPAGYRLRDLVPFHQLVSSPGGQAGQWRSTGDAARFLTVGLLPPGWFRIRLRLKSQAAARATLYIDTGSGFFPIITCPPEATAAGVAVEQFFKYAEPVRAVRLDPADVPTDFELEEFAVEALSGLQVFRRGLRRHVQSFPSRGGWLRALGNDLAQLATGRLGAFRARLREEFAPQPAPEPGTAASEPAPVQGDSTTKPQPAEPKPLVGTYAEWQRLHHLADADRAWMCLEARTMAQPPLFSVLLPVTDSSDRLLRPSVESVLAQLYPHWELCITGKGVDAAAISALLTGDGYPDARVKVAPVRDGPAAWNEALAQARGDYVVLLGPGDELAEHALYRLAETVAAERRPDFVYSDEDHLDENGRHVEPVFKPDWSPEYFLARPYTGRLAAYRTALVRDDGGFRSAFGDAQEYDLALRLVARGARIVHIPDILYHSRRSVASADTAAVRRALEDHLAATAQPGCVHAGMSPGSCRVRFTLVGRPKVSIVIPSSCRLRKIDGQTRSYLTRCLRSIRWSTTYDHFEVLVVGNSEIPPSLALEVARWRAVHIPCDGPLNIAAKMNLGAAAATGEHLLFLNDDTEVITPEWLESLLEFSQQPAVGAVGAKLFYPDGLVQHAGVVVSDEEPMHPYSQFPEHFPGPLHGTADHRNFLAVTGACVMTRADVFRAVGGFTEELPLDYNDIDYCLKVGTAGKRVVLQPYARLFHYEAVSKPNVLLDSASRQAFRKRWGAALLRDPFFSPNLAIYRNGPQTGVAINTRSSDALPRQNMAA